MYFFPNWHYASKYLRWRLSFQFHYTVAVLILGVDYKPLPLLTLFIVRLFSVAFILHSWWWWCCWNPSQLTWTEGEVRSSSQGHIETQPPTLVYTPADNLGWTAKPTCIFGLGEEVPGKSSQKHRRNMQYPNKNAWCGTCFGQR